MTLIIDGIEVSEYVSGLSQSYNKIFDTDNAFTSASGTEYKKPRGTQHSYSITLSVVPTAIKNQLKARNKKNSVNVFVGDYYSGFAKLRNFSASCTTENYWNVSFTLTATKIDKTKITLEDYSIKVYNNSNDSFNEYSTTGDTLLSDIVINLDAGGIPTQGILASQLTFSLDRNSTEFIPPNTNAKIEVTGLNCPLYYITSRSYTENSATFTATDRTIFLDLPFDYAQVMDKVVDEKVEVDEVLNVIVLDCGFWGHRTDGVTMSSLLYSDLENATCRDVLQLISECSLGVFFCDNGNNLVFQSFGGGDYELIIDEDNRTDITEGIVKGPITGIIAINDETEQTYRQGNTDDAYSCFKITSKYIDEDLANQILTQIAGKSYREFTIDHCYLARYPHIGCKVYGDADKSGNCFILSTAEIRLSPTGCYAKLGASGVSESEWDYEGTITRALKNKIEENKKYKGVSLSGSEGLVCEGTAGKVTMEDGSVYFYGTGNDEKYGFSTQSGGLTSYDGVLSSSKEVNTVSVDTTSNSVTVNYSDGHTYTYSADISKSDNTYNISNEKESFV